MKVLQLVPAMEQGGVERGVVEVNRILVGARWENVVVSAGGRLADEVARDGGRHVELDVKSKNPLTFFSRAAKLRKLILAERPDVVCAHSRVPAWLFRFAARGLGMPWITFAHGANTISRYSRIMTAGDLVVTPSRYIADYLKRAYGTSEEKIRVIPRAIDRSRFDLDSLDRAFVEAKRAEWGLAGRRVVMAVGRITQLKGYDVLVRAVARLADAPKLVIVGEAEALRRDVEASLRSLVAELGLADRVVFAGNQRKVAECLFLADVVVSSNVKKPEAFGRSMAEALAMGRPVVARAFGGALDVVRDGVDGVLVRGEEGADWPELFAGAISRAMGMASAAIRESALERFSFDRMAESTLAVYREAAGGEAESLLEVEDLHVRYGKFEAVKGVSFKLAKGEIFGIVGESGSGKSTIAKTLIGLEKASSGKVVSRASSMQMVFQDAVGSLNPRMTVRETLAEALRHGSGAGGASGRSTPRELLALVGLSDAVLDQYPREMSGGQCQRVSVARALACKPQVLIADEPVSALDVSVQARVLNLLRDLRRDLGLSILLIAHDLAVVKNVCDRICVMEKGLFVDSGDVAEVFERPKSDYTRRLLAAVPDVRTDENLAYKGEMAHA